MTPEDRLLRRHLAYLASLCPKLFSSSDRAYARLRELRTALSIRGGNLLVPCGQGSAHGCELPRQLEQWSRVLGYINVQLRERDNPGELAVVVYPSWYPHSFKRCHVQRSALLFHWLLVNHRCVTALRVDNWFMFDKSAYFRLFCDAVAKCTRLRSLQVSWLFRRLWMYKLLLYAMLRLPHLEEFTCMAIYTDSVSLRMDIMLSLATVIRTSTKLNRFAMEQFCDTHLGMSPITEALQSNVAISDLCLSVNAFKDQECRVFSQVLKEKRCLKSLHLIGRLERPTLSVAEVAAAVEGSKALVRLQLTGFRVDIGEAWALARSLCSADKVEQVALVSCIIDPSSECERGGDSYCRINCTVQPFIHMVRGMKTLRKLTFPVSASTSNDQRLLLGSLEKNDAVEEVRIENPTLEKSCRVFREAGIGAPWKIDSIASNDQLWDGLLKWGGFQCFHLSLSETASQVAMNRRFTQLITFRNLSILTVIMVGYKYFIGTEQAETFAHFLRDTSSLRKVRMEFFAKRRDSLVLLDGLRHNTTITDLAIQYWCQNRRTARLLAKVVCSSKRIQTLEYCYLCQHFSLAFFSALARSVQNNYSLLSLKTSRSIAAVRYLDRINGVLARNRALQVRAARFVTDRSFDKPGAEALELLGPDLPLVSKVQEMQSVRQEEAEGEIRRKLRDLDDMDTFMRASGVVREGVVCEESVDGRPGLDALPFHCWLHLRRFLRVSDVINQPVML